MKKNRFLWLIIILFITKTTALYAMAQPEAQSYKSTRMENVIMEGTIHSYANTIVKGTTILSDKITRIEEGARIHNEIIESDNEAYASVRSSDVGSSQPRHSEEQFSTFDFDRECFRMQDPLLYNMMPIKKSSQRKSPEKEYSSLLQNKPVTSTKKAHYNPNIDTDIVVKDSHVSQKRRTSPDKQEKNQESTIFTLRSESFEELPSLIDEPESTQPFKEDVREETQLHKAAKTNDLTLLDRIEVTEDLIRTKNKKGETAFHCAAKAGAKTFIEYLRRKQIAAYERDKDPFFYYLCNLAILSPKLVWLITDYTLDIIEELTKVLAMQDNSGCTPIMVAIKNDRANTAKLLIPRYEDLSIKNKLGETIKDLVQDKRFKQIKTLLKPTAIEKLHEEYFETIKLAGFQSFDEFEESEELDSPISSNIPALPLPLFLYIKAGNLDLVMENIKHYPNSINYHDENGDTPLHHAMRYAQFEIADYLDNTLDADQTKQNNKGELAINVHQYSTGETMLHTMVRLGILEIVSKLLIDYKANPNLTDNNRWSPLHVAAYHNYIEHAALLIDHEASLYARDKEGRTPLHIAIAKKHEETALFLIKKMIDFSFKDIFGVPALHAAIDTEQETIARQIVYKEKYSPYVQGTTYNQTLSKLLACILKALLLPSYKTSVSMKKDELMSLIEEYATSQPSILLKNHGKQTALHRAAQWSSPDKAHEMCTFLTKWGAKQDEKDALGHTYIKYLQDERIKQ